MGNRLADGSAHNAGNSTTAASSRRVVAQILPTKQAQLAIM
ncbi:MAG TPA: hypothetical protein VGP33_11025 [Chloroflexota bacterium]|jgi:hypothetical protein|nr:hypothetical protein [Chloroflexota bacterium]